MNMYCDKLKSIYQSTESSKYGIDFDVVKKADFFIKQKTTMMERNKINPLKFSIEMDVNEETSLMLFVIGSRCGLFKTRAFINCICGDQFELRNLDDEIKCNCGSVIKPQLNRDKIYLYFRLLEAPVSCEWLDTRKYQVDYLDGDALGKKFVSLVQIDNIIGEKQADMLLINQRDEQYRKFMGEVLSEGDS